MLLRNVILNGAKKDLRLDNGLIAQINDEILPLPEEEILEGEGLTVVPAFYNLHTHAAMSLMRGYADDLDLFTWLNEHIWPLEAKMTGDDIYVGTRLAVLEMIKSGTVHFDDMYWFTAKAAQAAKELGIRARIGLLVLSHNSNAEKLNQEVLEQLENYQGRVKISATPHAVYTVDEKTMIWVRDIAEKYNFTFHIHVSETAKEVEDCQKAHGLTPVMWLDKLGCLSKRTIAAHSIHLTDEDIKTYAKRGVTAVHVPGSNMKLCSGIFPYRKMKEAGVRVVFGTDGCCSSNDLSMFSTLREASYLAKLFSGDPKIAPAEEIYKMATRDSALAAGVDGGVIEEGKAADLLLLNLNLPEMTPNRNLISNIIYAASPECVDTVICDGQVLMRHRKVDGEEEILKDARKTFKRLIG